MKIYNFRQNPGVKAIIFAIVYLAAAFSICYFAFGGIDGMADKVNNLGAKAAGLLVGILILGPFIILLKFVSPKLKVEVGQDFLSIKTGKKQQNISFSEIGSMVINDKKLNTLKIFDRNGNLISSFSSQNDPDALLEIAADISKFGFNKENTILQLFGKEFHRITYTRA